MKVRYFFDPSKPAQWTTSPASTSAQSVIFTYEDVLLALKTDSNTYAESGSKVYHQVRGLPMGTNSAPLIADLYLHYYVKNDR